MNLVELLNNLNLHKKQLNIFINKKKIIIIIFFFIIFKKVMQIAFRLEFSFEACTVPSEEVKIVGTLEEMGKWNPAKALQLETY